MIQPEDQARLDEFDAAEQELLAAVERVASTPDTHTDTLRRVVALTQVLGRLATTGEFSEEPDDLPTSSGADLVAQVRRRLVDAGAAVHAVSLSGIDGLNVALMAAIEGAPGYRALAQELTATPTPA